MATNSNWTVVFDDKLIIKQSGDGAGTSYAINDDSFWSQSEFSNIWAIQHGTSTTSDEVEYRDSSPHSAHDPNVHGDFQQFITKWDSAHLAQLQSNWDNDEVDGETAEQKINRLGARPTSYSS
jgi:hypothetical protein|tara:strand:+ start:743 stop:1111 length:369 start_codon:yes stop_codon:yes gene_type:complete